MLFLVGNPGEVEEQPLHQGEVGGGEGGQDAHGDLGGIKKTEKKNLQFFFFSLKNYFYR